MDVVSGTKDDKDREVGKDGGGDKNGDNDRK
jgi:hypothetical protein